MMKLLVFIISVVLTATVSAEEIYKWVDGAGNVHYGDQPQGSRATKMKELPGLSTYAPPPVVEEKEAVSGDGDGDGDATAAAVEEQEPVAAYREIRLIKPEKEETIHSNEGLVDIFIALSPVLQKDDYFKVSLDGTALPQKYSSTVINLTGIDRGEHTVSVGVYNKAGVKKIGSASHKFYLHKVTVLKKSPKS